MDLEVHEIGPGGDPLIEQLTIVALHDLIAVREVGRHPTVDVSQPFGRESAFRPEPDVDGLRVPVLVMLDDHVEHGSHR